MSSLIRRATGSLVVALTAVGAWTVPAAAGQTGPTKQAEASSAPTMVVLDASGSMTATDAPGSRIAAAKRAVAGLVDRLPDEARVGLEVYGTSTGSAAAEKSAGCRDVKVVSPVATIDRAAFTARVRGIKASGYTPIGRALRTAASNLPGEGRRSIVLVSDGEDTCSPPDPCSVARDLKAQGVDLAVHTVGFKVDAKARAQLQCIARVSGGSYRDAADGPSLSGILGSQVERAIRGYRPKGSAITGGDTSGDAPVLRSGEQYLDSYSHGAERIGDTGTIKYYRVDLRDGDTPYVSATAVARSARAKKFSHLGVTVTMRGLDTSGGCSESDYGSGSSTIDGKVESATAVVAPDAVGAARSCLKEGPAVIKVERTGDAFADEPIDVELSYRVEGPADSRGLPGPAEPGKYEQPTVSGSATAITSGSSFNDAPRVDTGVYRDSFVPGETRYLKVGLEWGQRVSVAMSAAKQRGYSVDDGVDVRLDIANPLRAETTRPGGASGSAGLVGYFDESLYTSSAAPARYTNRRSSESNVRRFAYDGDYYLVVSTGFADSGRATPMPYTLRVQVSGTPEAGPKDDVRTPQDEPQDDPTTGSTPTQSPSTTGGGSASVTPSTVAGRAKNDPDVPTPAVVGGITVGLLLLAGLGAGLIGRRRRTVGNHDTRVIPTQDW